MRYDTGSAALLAPAVQELVDERVRDTRTPASSFALLADGAVVATGAAADERVGPRPTAGTAFRIASCTKSFTATAMLQLRDGGVLDLDTPVTEVLDLTMLDGRPSPTVAQLASMSSGIPYDDPWADRQEAMSTEVFDALLRDGVRLFADPGSRYEYSSFGYTILGRVLERVSGVPYVRLVTERVIEPLGLTGLGYDRTLDVEAIAPGHARVAGRWEEQPWQEPGAFSPLGGIVATSAGLAGWAAWLAAAWRPGADDAVLAAASRRELQIGRTDVPGPTRSSYGFGLVVEHDERHGTVISHSGGYPGYGAHMRWHPDSGLGVVVLENARYSGATLPATKALTALLDGLVVPDAEPDLWAATRAARETVERLVRRWDDGASQALVADNVALDEPLPRRRERAERLRAAIGLDPEAPIAPLAGAAPRSESAAHLAWSIRGTTGSLRCEIRMTPLREPRVETLNLRLG